MTQQIPIGHDSIRGDPSPDGTIALSPVLAMARMSIANVVFVGAPGEAGWVLIDTGIEGSADEIVAIAEARFGAASRPAAIVLTHGHFDHVGALEALAARWDVPVVAHGREHPFLDGTASYPPPAPRFADGLLSALSRFYPRAPVDVSKRLVAIWNDGTVPFLPSFRAIPTPGHSPGHVSFWNGESRTLIAGDAVITTAQEAAYAVATEAPELHGPPRYFTPDWPSAAASARTLAALEPELLVTGHGRALGGAAMRHALHRLAAGFEQIAVPPNAPAPPTSA